MSEHDEALRPGWVGEFLASIVAGGILGYIVYFFTHDRNLAIATAVICYTVVKAH